MEFFMCILICLYVYICIFSYLIIIITIITTITIITIVIYITTINTSVKQPQHCCIYLLVDRSECFSSRQVSGSDEELNHVERGKVLLFRNALPSSKNTKNYGKSPVLMGNLSINAQGNL